MNESNQLTQLVLTQIRKDPFCIHLITNPSIRLQLTAVRKNGQVLKIIRNPSREVIEAAIRNDPSAIMYVKDPDEKLQLMAVRLNGYTIRNIKHPSPKVQVAAVKVDPSAILLLKVVPNQLFDRNKESRCDCWPCEEAQLTVMKHIPHLLGLIPEEHICPKVKLWLKLREMIEL